MNFGKISKVLLLGGSRLTLEFAKHLKKSKYHCAVFTSQRQFDDIIDDGGLTFGQGLANQDINYFLTEDINKSKEFLGLINDETLIVGLGEPWRFSQKIISLCAGRLIDFMGIRLPQYRGGAHYTWQILRGNKIGACNIQMVNAETIQGVFDSGEIIKTRDYFFPSSVRTPNDYFDYAVKEEINFLIEFLHEIEQGVIFKPFNLQESFSVYFPRLNTKLNAFIDWSWTTQEIDRFICAFDNPYPGASTRLNNKLVRVKSSRVETNDGPFHPFQSGLVYKKQHELLYICTKEGSLIIAEVCDENGISIIDQVCTGDRFFTPREDIERGLQTRLVM